ncbi:MAG: tetratricopeptide repeat protein [Candidatus Melainabacteria bacterium]|nr:tetratricopeptide repeat protein [Candidatus Melainabacteria bacterium]
MLDYLERDWNIYKTQAEQADAAVNYVYSEAMWAMAVLIAQHFGARDFRSAYSLDGLSRALLRQQKYSLAEHFLGQCWNIKTKLSNASALEIAKTMNLVAELYFHQAKLADAIDMSKKALAIYRRVYEPSHPILLEIASNIAVLEGMTSPSIDPLIAAASLANNNQSRADLNERQLVKSASGNLNDNFAPTVTGLRKRRLSFPVCELCGVSMEAEWCIRCTGKSAKIVFTGEQLT